MSKPLKGRKKTEPKNREERLAEALRANLRRRKVPKIAPKAPDHRSSF